MPNLKRISDKKRFTSITISAKDCFLQIGAGSGANKTNGTLSLTVADRNDDEVKYRLILNRDDVKRLLEFLIKPTRGIGKVSYETQAVIEQHLGLTLVATKDGIEVREVADESL